MNKEEEGQASFELKSKPKKMEPELNVATDIMNKIFEASKLQIRNKILPNPRLLARFRIAMRTASQDYASNAHLDLLPNPGQFEDFFNKHTAELKEKANRTTIKHHIISTINALIKHINKMARAQKRLMNHTSNRIY